MDTMKHVMRAVAFAVMQIVACQSVVVPIVGLETHMGCGYGSHGYGYGSGLRYPPQTHTHVVGFTWVFAIYHPLPTLALAKCHLAENAFR